MTPVRLRPEDLFDPEPWNTPCWWWMSFAEPGANLGVAIVRGRGLVEAICDAHEHACNPGGSVAALRLVLPDGTYIEPPRDKCRRLMTRDQAEHLDRELFGPGGVCRP